MAISGQQVIQVGLQNESTGSDSLYDAFNKTKNNFSTLFENASQYTTFVAGTGISLTDVPSTGTLTIQNAGVTNIVAGTNITINQANGNVTISSNGGGGGGGGTVTSVGINAVSSSRLTVTNSPITSSGTMTVDLATSGVTPGTYTYPTLTVDTYGRVTSASSAAAAGTVTSVGVIPGDGIQVTGSPVTTSGNINILNTGVTRLNAGTGISLSGSNGNVTVSTTVTGGTVTGVTVSSTTLTITGSPITTTGTITINLPSAITLTGNITGGNLLTGGLITATGNIEGGNLRTGGRLNVTGNSNVGNIGATNGVFSGALSGITTATIATGNITTINSGLLQNGNSNITITANSNVSITAAGGATELVVTSTGANIVGTFDVTGNANTGNLGTTTAVITNGNITTINSGLLQNGTSNIAITNNGNISITAAGGSPELVITSTGANITGYANISGNTVVGNLTTAGSILSSGSSGIGYSTGSGGAVTQLTSRTTGVTLDKINGSITLFTAAGVSTYTSFTVTNSTVAATDVVVVSQRSGTDKYETFVSNTAAGSFQITFADRSGTTSEAPVFNFVVIKAVAA
jgi:hypothetical protein